MIAGIVLAGGQSTRFGTDKARFKVNGQPLVMRTVEQLAPLVDICYVTANQHNFLPIRALFTNKPQIEVIPDSADYLNIGPLGGLYAVLARHSNLGQILMLPTDYPQITTDDLVPLLGKLNQYPVVEEQAHYSVCYFEPDFNTLKQQLQQGDYRLRQFLNTSQCQALNYPVTPAFENMNTRSVFDEN